MTAETLVGTWDLSPLEGLRGPHLTVLIDSARGSRFYGRLTRVLSGDMELSENFLPFRGTVDTNGVAKISIRARERGVPGSQLTGRASGDIWVLTGFVWSGEEQVRAGRNWELRRVSK